MLETGGLDFVRALTFRPDVQPPHFWLTKVRYISTRYTIGITVSTPISMNVGAGQLVAHIW
jgi:hypothetical protein